MAVRIGGELEQLDKQRERAADAMFLIKCYSDFCRGDASRLESLRRTGSLEDSIKCAVVARQLTMIARRAEGNSHSRELIEKFSETLEKDLLKQFDKAYRKARWDPMKVGYYVLACVSLGTKHNRTVPKFFTTLMGVLQSLKSLSISTISSSIWKCLSLARLYQKGICRFTTHSHT